MESVEFIEYRLVWDGDSQQLTWDTSLMYALFSSQHLDFVYTGTRNSYTRKLHGTHLLYVLTGLFRGQCRPGLGPVPGLGCHALCRFGLWEAVRGHYPE